MEQINWIDINDHKWGRTDHRSPDFFRWLKKNISEGNRNFSFHYSTDAPVGDFVYVIEGIVMYQNPINGEKLFFNELVVDNSASRDCDTTYYYRHINGKDIATVRLKLEQRLKLLKSSKK